MPPGSAHRRLAARVAVVVLAVLAALPASAPGAVTDHTLTAEVQPAVQPPADFGNASVRIDIDAVYDETKAPRVTEAAIHFDDDFYFDPTSLATCEPADLQGTTTAEAIAACPGSKLGSGAADFEAVADETTYQAVVTAFNGEHGVIGAPSDLYLHVRSDENDTTGIYSGRLEASQDVAGASAVLKLTTPINPAIVLTHLDFSLGGDSGAADDNFFHAACADNEPGHTWNFEGRFTYSDSQVHPASATQQCELPVELPSFGPSRAVASATNVGGASEQETGDVNDDGITDVVVSRLTFQTHNTWPIGVFLGDGEGGFTDGSSLFEGAIPETEHGRQILIADFNGDDRNDIFVADHGYDASPYPGYPDTLVLSTPEGKLADASDNIPVVNDYTHSAATADVDDDGDLDIYLGNLGGGDSGKPGPQILENDGTGNFTNGVGMLPGTLVGLYTRSLFVDVDTDTDPDLILGGANYGSGKSKVLLNDGEGHFTALGDDALPPKEFGPTAIFISHVELDVNEDDVPDLIVGFQREDFSGRRLQVLIGNGNGTFRDETAARLPFQDEGQGWPYAIRPADFNGDGRTDFAVSVMQENTSTAVYIDDGTGVFRFQKVGAAVMLRSVLDANGDGYPDLFNTVSGSPEGHAVQLQITAADSDGDGVPNPTDGCDQLAGFSESGCPSRARSLTLNYSARREQFTGKITSSAQCAAAQEVKIFREAAAGDKKAGEATSNARRIYKLSKAARRGDYYARVEENVLPDVAACAAAQSPSLKVR